MLEFVVRLSPEEGIPENWEGNDEENEEDKGEEAIEDAVWWPNVNPLPNPAAAECML